MIELISRWRRYKSPVHKNSMEKSMGSQRVGHDWVAFTLFSYLNCSNLGYKELFHLVLVLLWHKFIYYFGASLPSGSAKCSRSSWYFLLQAWNRISKEPWFMVLENGRSLTFCGPQSHRVGHDLVTEQRQQQLEPKIWGWHELFQHLLEPVLGLKVNDNKDL